MRINVPWNYYEKFQDLTNEYMPDYDEGLTMASQLVTAVNKLVYKWYNDGDVFDNSYYLEGWANDLSDYANWLYDNIPESRASLNCIVDAKNEYEYELILKELADKLLTEEMMQKYKVFDAKGSIYTHKGKFKFHEYMEDEEDEEMD